MRDLPRKPRSIILHEVGVEEQHIGPLRAGRSRTVAFRWAAVSSLAAGNSGGAAAARRIQAPSGLAQSPGAYHSQSSGTDFVSPSSGGWELWSSQPTLRRMILAWGRTVAPEVGQEAACPVLTGPRFG